MKAIEANNSQNESELNLSADPILNCEMFSTAVPIFLKRTI